MTSQQQLHRQSVRLNEKVIPILKNLFPQYAQNSLPDTVSNLLWDYSPLINENIIDAADYKNSLFAKSSEKVISIPYPDYMFYNISIGTSEYIKRFLDFVCYAKENQPQLLEINRVLQNNKSLYYFMGSKSFKVRDFIYNAMLTADLPSEYTFYDLFGGTGNVSLHLPENLRKGNMVLNEYDAVRYRVFKDLRDNPKLLQKHIQSFIEKYPDEPKKLFDESGKYLNSIKHKKSISPKHTAAYLAHMRLCYKGKTDSFDKGKDYRKLHSLLQDMRLFSFALKDIELKNADALDLLKKIEKADKPAVVYSDSPYLFTENRCSNGKKIYEFPHEILAKRMHSLNAQGHIFFLSYRLTVAESVMHRVISEKSIIRTVQKLYGENGYYADTLKLLINGNPQTEILISNRCFANSKPLDELLGQHLNLT